jgi:septal ring factor EnvC (AmiA/AmiB activator)
MRYLLCALALCLGTATATAQSPAAEQARAASAALDEASLMLAAAEDARDRVRALTQTIQAFETGLAAMREGLRQASINEAQLRQKLASQDAEVAALLGVLQSMGNMASPVVFLHPDGPVGTARAGMLLGELTPALNRRVDVLRTDLENVQILRALQVDAAARLQQGLTEVQNARTALNQAMANRTDLPQRFTADPIRTAILLASSETLDGFASGLSEIVTEETEPARQTLDGRIGDLPLPAQGLILRRAGEADAAGVTRPGLILATRPGAIVTTPTAATIRYAGPLLDFSEVMILEPRAGTIFVLAGLDVVYGEAGQVIEKDTPVGLMGGAVAKSGDELSPLRDGTGLGRSETLYIEVRTENTPQDPSDWFRTDEDR